MSARVKYLVDNLYAPRVSAFFPKLGRGHTSRGHCCSGKDHIGGNEVRWAEERGYMAITLIRAAPPSPVRSSGTGRADTSRIRAAA